jgi:hypothetical protein
MSSAHRPRARPLGCRFLPKTVRGLSCKCRVMAQPGRAVHRPAAPLTGLVRPFSGVLRVSAVQVYFSIQSGFHPECRGSNWNCLQNRWCEGAPIGADWDPTPAGFPSQHQGCTTTFSGSYLGADFTRRVEDAITAASTAVQKARRSAVILGFATAAFVLAGAAAAWYAACAGGRHRDNVAPPLTWRWPSVPNPARSRAMLGKTRLLTPR